MTKTYPAPLSGPSFGSYSPDDVLWLLKDLSDVQLEGSIEEREAKIQAGKAHYAESLPQEYQPTEQYQKLFSDSLTANKTKLAEAVAVVAEQIYKSRNNAPVLVSLARAGTPIGVLIKRYLKVAYGYEAPHYAVSIVRDRGIDYNALGYIAEHHDVDNVIFVDGWTGKGAITKELAAALDTYYGDTGVRYSADVAVLADPGNCVRIYGTRDDYLIPSACLNSTVSGLISRTVLNADYIGPDDYHGGKFYKELADADVSNLFLDTITSEFSPEIIQAAQAATADYSVEANTPTWEGWAAVEKISEEYGIHNPNWVKPGVGETTRVLLRRVPWKVLIRPDKYDELLHIRLLAENRNVPIELVEDLPYSAVGLIHPNFSQKGE